MIHSLEPASSGEGGAARQEPLGLSALIVDDDEGFATVLQIFLEGLGWDAVVAGSVEEAIEAIHECPPDLITLDMLLPGTSGCELFRRIKTCGATSEIPVVVISAAVDADPDWPVLLRSFLEPDHVLPPLGYLGKPLELKRLRGFLDDVAASSWR